MHNGLEIPSVVGIFCKSPLQVKKVPEDRRVTGKGRRITIFSISVSRIGTLIDRPESARQGAGRCLSRSTTARSSQEVQGQNHARDQDPIPGETHVEPRVARQVLQPPLWQGRAVMRQASVKQKALKALMYHSDPLELDTRRLCMHF